MWSSHASCEPGGGSVRRARHTRLPTQLARTLTRPAAVCVCVCVCVRACVRARARAQNRKRVCAADGVGRGGLCRVRLPGRDLLLARRWRPRRAPGAVPCASAARCPPPAPSVRAGRHQWFLTCSWPPVRARGPAWAPGPRVRLRRCGHGVWTPGKPRLLLLLRAPRAGLDKDRPLFPLVVQNLQVPTALHAHVVRRASVAQLPSANLSDGRKKAVDGKEKGGGGELGHHLRACRRPRVVDPCLQAPPRCWLSCMPHTCGVDPPQ